MSISPTFYEQLFRAKVFVVAEVWVYTFLALKIGGKADLKMLVKLTSALFLLHDWKRELKGTSFDRLCLSLQRVVANLQTIFPF